MFNSVFCATLLTCCVLTHFHHPWPLSSFEDLQTMVPGLPPPLPSTTSTSTPPPPSPSTTSTPPSPSLHHFHSPLPPPLPSSSNSLCYRLCSSLSFMQLHTQHTHSSDQTYIIFHEFDWKYHNCKGCIVEYRKTSIATRPMQLYSFCLFPPSLPPSPSLPLPPSLPPTISLPPSLPLSQHTLPFSSVLHNVL